MASGKKEIFLEKLNALCSNKNYNNVFLSFDERENIINILKGVHVVDNNKYYRLKKRFEVINVDGILKLIKLRKSSDDSILFVSCNEELYEILLQAHISTGHGGRDRMIKEINLKYTLITRETVSIFLSLCEDCKLKKSLASKKIVVKPIGSNSFMSKCQIDLIDYQSRPDGDYKFVLVFQDHFTKFVQLRPLKSNMATEVAWELYNIFCIFGAPSILHTDNGREFENKVFKELLSYWPECKLVHGKPRNSQSQGGVERANQDVENILITAMADHKTNNWAKLLPFVQISKNRALHAEIHRSPYESLFGSPLKIGINGLSIPKDMIHTINTEEVYLYRDAERAKAENINQSNQMEGNSERQNVSIHTEGREIENRNVTEKIDNVVDVSEESAVDNENNNETTKEAQLNPIVVASESIFLECAENAMDNATNICLHCARRRDIDNARNQTKVCQDLQANKILGNSAKRLKGCSVGDNVIIPIPSLDRGRTEHRNVLGVVLNEENGFYKLGTKAGILTQCYTRNEFDTVTKNFLTVAEVPERETSLRSTVSISSTTGQGMMKCNCTKKCCNKSCKCLKNKVLCNSRCHFSNPCKNK